jgi:hypothetical protein
MSLLSIIQQHCRIHALSVPTGVIGSTETTVNQLYGIVNEVLSELVTESKFNVTTQECTFTTVATESQGAMATLCPLGYQYAIFETFYDRTLMRPLIGPITESEWQELKALPTAGIMYKYRIRNDELLFDPVPSAPFSEIAFEYMSSYCVTDDLGVLKPAITADTDLFVFPENIIQKGMMYRWKQIKGLPYQADETRYYGLLNNYIARDKVKRRIDVSQPSFESVKPGIFVPSNSWNV